MSSYQSDSFFQYATTSHKTNEGIVDLPMFFYDAAFHFALFYVDIDKARILTRSEDLEPTEFHKGKALAAIASFNYRKAALSPYLEAGLAIASTPMGVSAPTDPAAALLGDPDSHHVGFYVLDLPVTTDQATSAGIDLWGFPKFTTTINFNLDNDRFEGSVIDPETGSPIYTLSGNSLGGATLPAMNMVYHTRFNGKTLRSHCDVRGAARYALPGTMTLKISDSNQRLARNMKTLGLGGARPDLVFYGNQVQMRLSAGAPVSD